MMSFDEVITSDAIEALLDMQERIRFFESLPLPLGAGLKLATRTETGAYTVTKNDFAVNADASGGAFAVNFPASATISGYVFAIKKIDAVANVTLTPNGAELIDGAASFALTAQYEAVIVQADGTGINILAKYL